MPIEKLLDVLGDDVTQDQAFAHAYDVLKNAVGDIIHLHVWTTSTLKMSRP